jgi:hypothetical protein
MREERRTYRAVGNEQRSGTLVGHGAGVGGVKDDLVLGLLRNTFDDVDLAIGRPGAGSQSPEGRPSSACARRHVSNVGDEETAGIGLLRLDADGFPADGVMSILVRVVNSNVCRATGCSFDQAETFRVGLGLVLDEARSRVSWGPDKDLY